MLLKKKISNKHFRQLYRSCQISQKLLNKLLFHIQAGIIKKVEHLEVSRKLSPLAIAAHFKIKKKKKIGAKM